MNRRRLLNLVAAVTLLVVAICLAIFAWERIMSSRQEQVTEGPLLRLNLTAENNTIHAGYALGGEIQLRNASAFPVEISWKCSPKDYLDFHIIDQQGNR